MPPPRERQPMAEYRIDDLARGAGTTARNVRACQQRGLLRAAGETRSRGRTSTQRLKM